MTKIDQLESTHPGMVPTYKGIPSTSTFHEGTIFVNHASRFLHFTAHHSTGAIEAINAKNSFELLASTYHCSPKAYRTDNGVFATKLFKDACHLKWQKITYCGADAHHQNGIAERYIRTITESARTMLIHAMLSWPEIITENLWPFAIQYAVDLHNNTPSSCGISPLEIFSGTKHHNILQNFHTSGCPLYVLEPTLCQNHKLPRWKPRSRVGIFIGFSPHHASSVPLVLSTTTGLVSPQFHVVFDDLFSTTKLLHTNSIPDNWPQLFDSSAISYVDSDFSQTNIYDTTSLTDPSPHLEPSELTIDQGEATALQREHSSSQRESSTSTFSSSNSTMPDASSGNSLHIDPPPNSSSAIHPGWNPNHSYNTRFRAKHTVNIATFSPTFHDTTLHHFLSTHDIRPFSTPLCYQSLPPSFLHSTTNSDTLHLGSMHTDPDRLLFEQDMRREISDLLATDTIEIVPHHLLPSDNKPLQAIWSFHRKRAPDWTVLKHKARLCLHGGMQIEGVNFWETYAPVVSWRTTRLILVLSLLSGLKSHQVDYVSAYTQAPLDCELFMNIPPSFVVANNTLVFTTSSTKGNSHDYVLHLKKNVYGLRQAGNNWFHELCSSLLALGFHQSKNDPCLFIRNNCLIIVYVDDCLLFAKTDDILDSIISTLKANFNLTSQGDVGAFLGIDIKHTPDGNLELVQSGLISKIITLAGLEQESNEHRTPATAILHANPKGPDREHTWNYHTINGMLTYLSSSTRLDIAFAVHQCARFSTNPKRLHEIAVRHIIWYLKGTKDKGFILKPSPSRTLDFMLMPTLPVFGTLPLLMIPYPSNLALVTL